MPRPLKVYRAHLGFFDTVVAAHSQKDALAAWGGAPGEFRQGFASVTDDEKAVTAALATPGVALYRPFGSSGAFTADKSLKGAALPAAETPRASKPKKPRRQKSRTRER